MRPTYIAVASWEEYEAPAVRRFTDIFLKTYKGAQIVTTGVGGASVVSALQGIPRDCRIINVGFCASSAFAIGDAVGVSACEYYMPKSGIKPVCHGIHAVGIYGLPLVNTGALCCTVGDFLTEKPADDAPLTVYDMELAFIRALGFHEVCAIKIVSDNFNFEQYQQATKH